MPQCPYCHGTQFYEGPSGGLSTNIMCANLSCRHWFNYTPMTGTMDDLNRVEPTPKQQTAERAIRATANRKREFGIYLEGIELYRQDASARSCIRQVDYAPIPDTEGNFLRLAGYLDAMNNRIKTE